MAMAMKRGEVLGVCEYGSIAKDCIKWDDEITLHDTVQRYVTSISVPKIANNRPFEEVSEDQHDPNARCASFCTSPARMCGWICAITQRYYEELGDATSYQVNWTDKGSVEGAGSDAGPFASSKIILYKKLEGSETSEKLITITIFYSTLTIMAQGITVSDFVKAEFPVLKGIVDTIYAEIDIDVVEGDITHHREFEDAMDTDFGTKEREQRPQNPSSKNQSPHPTNPDSQDLFDSLHLPLTQLTNNNVVGKKLLGCAGDPPPYDPEDPEETIPMQIIPPIMKNVSRDRNQGR
jgi:hypothetical protein